MRNPKPKSNPYPVLLPTSTPCWTRVRWHGNYTGYDPKDSTDYDSWECWQLKRVVLYPNTSTKTVGVCYVASYGPNSDLSHSGFLPGCRTMVEAKLEIERLLTDGKIGR